MYRPEAQFRPHKRKSSYLVFSLWFCKLLIRVEFSIHYAHTDSMSRLCIVLLSFPVLDLTLLRWMVTLVRSFSNDHGLPTLPLYGRLLWKSHRGHIWLYTGRYCQSEVHTCLISKKTGFIDAPELGQQLAGLERNTSNRSQDASGELLLLSSLSKIQYVGVSKPETPSVNFPLFPPLSKGYIMSVYPDLWRRQSTFLCLLRCRKGTLCQCIQTCDAVSWASSTFFTVKNSLWRCVQTCDLDKT